MKIKPEHYATLAPMIRAALTRIPSVQAYQACHESIPRIHLAKDRAMRHRWDALHACGEAGREWTREVYKYANDSHIDTALKAAVYEVTP